MSLWLLIAVLHRLLPLAIPGLLAAGDSAPYFIILAEQYAPILAAAVVTIVLVRTGASQKLTEYRRETMEMVRTRSELLEKQLAEAHGEIVELQKEVKRRDRRIENLEDEMAELRQQIRVPRSRPQPAPPPPRPTPIPAPTPDSPPVIPGDPEDAA